MHTFLDYSTYHLIQLRLTLLQNQNLSPYLEDRLAFKSVFPFKTSAIHVNNNDFPEDFPPIMTFRLRLK